jgi:hypothetical protein
LALAAAGRQVLPERLNVFEKNHAFWMKWAMTLIFLLK